MRRLFCKLALVMSVPRISSGSKTRRNCEPARRKAPVSSLITAGESVETKTVSASTASAIGTSART